MNYLVVIPARYKSKRFPGKPLAKIAGVSMIERTFKQCIKCIPKEKVIVATDDKRIVEHCKSFGARTIMTPLSCKTGTDRVACLLDNFDEDVFINVQGDEPLVNPDDLLKVLNKLKTNKYDVVNGYCEISEENQFYNKNIPKVVFSEKESLLYMSRAPVPSDKSGGFIKAWRQVCVYGFSRKALDQLRSLKSKTFLEEIEDIEILRFLEIGINVQLVQLSDQSIAVDVPEDIAKVEKALLERGES